MPADRRGAARATAPVAADRPRLLLWAFAAVCVALSVSGHLYDTDMWQHLAVGRAIWTLHRVPTTQIWTWPTYGAPDVNYAWGFETLVWPFWTLGGVAGLFVWRWLTTLAAFALVAAVSRRMGARGTITPVVIALAALAFRDRAAIRPESLVAVLIPLELLILEARRRGGADHAPWLIAIQWLWANVHVSWPIGVAFLLLFEWDARSVPRSDGARPRSLLPVIAASIAVSFLNPFGWKTVTQPFVTMLVQRQSALYRRIEELRPLSLGDLLRTWAIVMFAAWPVLILARVRRAGIDRVEVGLWLAFSALALSGMRFLGPWALVAGPYVARDLDAWARTAARPSSTALRAARAAAPWIAIAGILVGGVILPTRTGVTPRIGVDVEWSLLPVGTTDYMESRGVRGRGFNAFETGGWLLHRFWPDSTRLPFIDIHQAGTASDLDAYAALGRDPAAWPALDGRHRFAWALVNASAQASAIDEDSSFVPVYREDAAVLYVRRDGPLAAIAARDGDRVLPGGGPGLQRMLERAARDTAFAARAEAEARRAVTGARHHSFALRVLSLIEARRGEFAAAARDSVEASRLALPRPR